MQLVKYDPEILYVQKLYFFIFLVTFSLLAGAIAFWRFGWHTALIVFSVSLAFSYLAMLKKKSFNPPQKRTTAQRMEGNLSGYQPPGHR